MPLASKRQASDGSTLWWGGADAPGPPHIVAPGRAAVVLAAVSPMRPGHSVAVEYRVDGGPVREAIGVLEPHASMAPKPGCFARLCRGNRTGWSSSCRCFVSPASQSPPVSTEMAECPRYQVGCAAPPVETLNLRAKARARFAESSLAMGRAIPRVLHDPAAQGSGRRAAGRTADQLAL